MSWSSSLLVYRAPILALLPLLAVGAACLVATGVVYLLIEAGLIVVDVEGTLLLLVLIFGTGTDYSMLLTHRYCEEIGRGREPPAALPLALRESVPALAGFAGTVIAAMLVLLLADLQSTHWLGRCWQSASRRCSSRPSRSSRPCWRRSASAPSGPQPRRFSLCRPDLNRPVPRRRSHFPALSAGKCERRRGFSLGNLASHGTIGFGQGEIGSTDSAVAPQCSKSTSRLPSARRSQRSSTSRK